MEGDKTEVVTDSEKNNKYLIPASIIAAGALIAFAVFYTNGNTSPGGQNGNLQNSGSVAAKNMRPVDSTDHIIGNPNAAIKIVEYSDLECPFCKTYHPTIKRIVDEYGKDGQVAWVYRHFPIDSIHPKARKEAEATECVAEIGGNNAFWNYLEKIFAVTPSNNKLDPAKLPEIAEQIGIDRAKFETCLSSGKYADKIQRDYEDAVKAGGDGTPFTIIATSKGEFFPFSGALPYSDPVKTGVKEIIEQAIKTI